MDFASNQEPQIKKMLAAIGITSIEELFSSIPSKLKISKPLADDGLSEYEGMRLMEAIAARNLFSHFESYLGAGAYEHHVPALVGAICGKSEFLTSYTPYQPEASQGMLQIIFEFQSAICALTDMDVSNASVYDGASACAEAVLMALRINQGKNKLIVAGSLNPHYEKVVQQYLQSHLSQIETIPFNEDGTLNFQALDKSIDTDTAAILVQSPNFFGVLEDVRQVVEKAKQREILTILSANPLTYGLFASAGELGVDIAVGDCQPLGLPLHFGGPYVGYMACRQDLVRQMPGRIVGETVDTQGRRGFVLTLQAREQHIRREKATSNICTNQALAALATLVGMMWYGKEGLKKLALTNYQRSTYLKKQLQQINGVQIMGNQPTFNEFVVKWPKSNREVQEIFRKQGIEPGLDLEEYFPFLKKCMLVAVTETKSQEQLDRYCEVAKSLGL